MTTVSQVYTQYTFSFFFFLWGGGYIHSNLVTGHVTIYCVEVGPMANVREGSTQEHDWARVREYGLWLNMLIPIHF